MLRPVEKQRVAEEIVEQLRELILTGHYPPGAKLPPERELSKRLGVNRASLREALKKLEHLGLVRIRQGDGTRVQNFMETGGIELVSYLLPLAPAKHPRLLRDTLEFRRVFGREVARLAALRAQPEHLDRLRAIADKAAGDVAPEELFDLDFEFYVALTAGTCNQVMGLLINTVREAVQSYASVLTSLTDPAEEVRAHHRALLTAIEARDAEAAARTADHHLERGAQRVLAIVDKDGTAGGSNGAGQPHVAAPSPMTGD
ncbi:FadR/GntR family transcriptional regulator [Haliangium sp.]|uniref:FadR/GntR family transcriptional regulator n=1 Tax=Haliangium sp. TaxID=2663208 RepID=UPI003D110689